MSKVIAAFNMTLDGICDHTTGVPSEELHEHYSDLLNNSGVILYGRTTYELMLFWKTILENPTGKNSMDDFAVSIDKVQKIVFSRTLKDTNWITASLAVKSLNETILELRQNSEKQILVGSRSLIVQLLNSNLIDEFQICIHPVIEGKGLQLFDQIKNRIRLKLIKTKTLDSGSVIFYYKPLME